MEDNFQPLYEEKDSEAFNIWDIKGPEPEPVIEVDPQEEFAKECERLREEARNTGYQEGLKQAAEHVQSKQRELAACITLLQQPTVLLDNALTQEIIKTIIWICEACIGIELSINPEKLTILMELVKQELPSLNGYKQLAMHPDDVDFIINELSEIRESAATYFLVADPTLKRGDFYLKNEYSDLDGRLSTRLQKLFETYLQDEESLNNLDAAGSS
ncbi:Flagellar assembly protein FliH [Legionella massiliensis]|uniref:Flagellar assembly protein FliH n=1 Tax=Legionella massiliensis TaxID=1034943 RepID=A0A078L3A8_9GAMM|nr:FliH/SctL family protein [Legionella massiliensis]CDZ78604.1 Flagellar assembly protein FliH [Legionella massiliensis]CEE14342.1 Flagellar assembly protein FliH [Legionella massiliensis]